MNVILLKSNKIIINFFVILFFFRIINFFLFLFFFKKRINLFFKWEFIFLNSNSLEFIIYLDWISFSFLRVVLFISSMVRLYSIEYIRNKKEQFIYLIFLFVFSMVILIIRPNIITILLGWDGLGLVSYILIIFFQRDKSKNSGILTIILNRIGDVLIIFSSFILFLKGGLNFFFYSSISNYFLILLVILAGITKRAQIPFSSWLPAAIAAPTPVSSLVHSSTLVTAGVYLIIRFRNYFFFFSLTIKFILLFSTLTIFISGIAANYEIDLNKVIALSTLSQLGLIIITLSINYIIISFFHLITHALFKALLFLCAGIILHNIKNNQDIQYIGKIIVFIPFTTICFNVANLSLCGFLFLRGFYSKDIILDNFFINKNNIIIFVILIISTGLTVSYTLRLTFFLSIKNINSFIFLKIKESKVFRIVLILITIFSIIIGFFFNILLCIIFYEPRNIPSIIKLIIPLIIFLFFNIRFLFYKKKIIFFSSIWFLSLNTLSLKNLPIFLNSKSFNSSNFGFFEFVGRQGLYKYLMLVTKKKRIYIFSNLKILTFLRILIFLRLRI